MLHFILHAVGSDEREGSNMKTKAQADFTIRRAFCSENCFWWTAEQSRIFVRNHSLRPKDFGEDSGKSIDHRPKFCYKSTDYRV